jgi:ribulose-5-phosphate 4-epimerase/fuculose-1-phosphate aldolase
MILQNHGLLTVGETVHEAAWWFISMERTCQSQLLAEAAGKPVLIEADTARLTQTQVGSKIGGWFSFQPIYEVMVAESPEMFDED